MILQFFYRLREVFFSFVLFFSLRFKDEFVKHKILDFIGDIYLAGNRIIGEFTAFKTGHGVNNQFLRKLFADKDAWRII